MNESETERERETPSERRQRVSADVCVVVEQCPGTACLRVCVSRPACLRCVCLCLRVCGECVRTCEAVVSSGARRCARRLPTARIW